MSTLQFDSQFQQAFDLLHTSDHNVFLTGNAGSGKSTLLSYFIQQYEKKCVLLAPTGVAALNIQGETIHSFFGFQPGVTIDEAKLVARRSQSKDLYKSIHTLIIDEISMVRADLLDCVDVFLKKVMDNPKPFGGIRIIFIGDLYQLPPVVTRQEEEGFQQKYKSPYFFSSEVMQDLAFHMEFIELEKIYRQTDEKFIHLLNSIRKNTINDEELLTLNQRVVKDIDDTDYLHLVSTNARADQINGQKLLEIKEKSYFFEASTEGDFQTKIAPTSTRLELKKGAQVMFVSNHFEGRWVNGSIGVISDFGSDHILVKLEDGHFVLVYQNKWTFYKYELDPDTKKLTKKSLGSFEQYPLKLAWAITIHKSQGKTFDKVIFDLERGAFAHGQVYVGLSRCRSMDNLILKKPLKKHDIRMDYRVMQFLTTFQYNLSEKKQTKEEKLKRISQAIQEKKPLTITYLKANDVKSKRVIHPTFYGEINYRNRKILALEAFCETRNETRMFRVERILEIQ